MDLSFAGIIGIMFWYLFGTWAAGIVIVLTIKAWQYILPFLTFLALPFAIIYDGVKAIREK